MLDRDRADAARERNSWGFDRIGEKNLELTNQHVKVRDSFVTCSKT